MKKIAGIDIGTNSILYSLFEVRGQKSLRELYFERHSPRIGSKLAGQRKPVINADSLKNVRKILTKNIRHARNRGAKDILIAATSPLRLAQNGREIKRRLETDLGQKVAILSPEREAELSFLGAVGRLRKNQTAVVVDMGGGSTELVIYRGNSRLAFVSISEGAVSLTEKFNSTGLVDYDDYGQFEDYLSRYVKKALIVKPYLNYPVTLVGGTSTALAYLKDRNILQSEKGVILSRKDIDLFVDILSGLGLNRRRQLLTLDRKRAEIIFAGAFWYRYLFKILKIGRARATARGLRHGMVLDFLDKAGFTA